MSDPAPFPALSWSGKHSLALLLLLAAALGSLAPFLGYLTDDAFIHFQFAKHIVQGNGFSFNAGEPTYGSASPLWVLLLALAGKVAPIAVEAPRDASSMPAVAWAAKLCGALFHGLAIWLIVRLGRRLGWDAWTSLGAGALLAAHAWAVRWSLSGTESALAVAAVAAALYLLAGVLLEGKPAWPAGAALGLCTMARPEGYLFAGLALAAVCGGAERRARRTLELLAGSAVVLVPWLFSAWRWFHTVIPSAAAARADVWAKPGLAIASIHSAIQVELATDVLPLALFVLVLAFGSRSTALPAALGRRSFWMLVVAWPPLLALSFALGGAQIVSRYALPATPCILLLGMASLRWIAATAFPKHYALLLPGFLVAFSLQNGILTALVGAPHAKEHTRGLRGSLVSLGIWARDQTPPGAYFAAADIGAFGYYSERRVLDLRGIVTPAIAPVLAREGYNAVVKQLLFEAEGRPGYLIDRHPSTGRLARDPLETNPYRVVLAREFANLSTVRPSAYSYTVYSIDWSVVDRTRRHVAERTSGEGGSDPSPGRARAAGRDARIADARARIY